MSLHHVRDITILFLNLILCHKCTSYSVIPSMEVLILNKQIEFLLFEELYLAGKDDEFDILMAMQLFWISMLMLHMRATKV